MISVHLVLNNVKNNTRVLKITHSLIKYQLATECYTLGYWEKNLKQIEVVDSCRTNVRFKTPLKILQSKGKLKKRSIFRIFLVLINKYFYFFQTITFLKKKKVEFINCHHSKLLPFAYLIAKLKKSKLIYCPHELESERTGVSKFENKISYFFEKIFLKRCLAIVVVCKPIEDWYKKEFGIKNIYTLPNYPENKFQEGFSMKINLKNKFSIKEHEVLFIYQGVISLGRDLEELIEVFEETPNVHLLLMGYGHKLEELKLKASTIANIHFHDAVSLENIVSYTSGADIGIFFLINKPHLSYQYSLPNKFGEYLIAGLPVVVSSYTTYLKDLILEKNCGWVLEPSKESLKNFINFFNEADYINKKSNASIFGKEIDWNKCDKILNDIYI